MFTVLVCVVNYVMQENGGGSLRHVNADNDLRHVKTLLLICADKQEKVIGVTKPAALKHVVTIDKLEHVCVDEKSLSLN